MDRPLQDIAHGKAAKRASSFSPEENGCDISIYPFSSNTYDSFPSLRLRANMRMRSNNVRRMRSQNWLQSKLKCALSHKEIVMAQAKMGGVSLTREGDAAHFECECGAEETVANYENGQRPKRFEWRMGFNSEYSRCTSCGREHKGELGKKYN